MRDCVELQLCFPFKIFPTLGAYIGFFINMNYHVEFQVFFGKEIFIAGWTLCILDAKMNSHMLFQMLIAR